MAVAEQHPLFGEALQVGSGNVVSHWLAIAAQVVSMKVNNIGLLHSLSPHQNVHRALDAPVQPIRTDHNDLYGLLKDICPSVSFAILPVSKYEDTRGAVLRLVSYGR